MRARKLYPQLKQESDERKLLAGGGSDADHSKYDLSERPSGGLAEAAFQGERAPYGNTSPNPSDHSHEDSYGGRHVAVPMQPQGDSRWNEVEQREREQQREMDRSQVYGGGRGERYQEPDSFVNLPMETAGGDPGASYSHLPLRGASESDAGIPYQPKPQSDQHGTNFAGIGAAGGGYAQ